jgi:hypothetical protein
MLTLDARTEDGRDAAEAIRFANPVWSLRASNEIDPEDESRID